MAVLRRDSAVAISSTDLDLAAQASHETPASLQTKDLSLNKPDMIPTATNNQELNALDSLALRGDETDSKVSSTASDKKKMKKKKKAKLSVVQKQASDGPNSSSSGTLDHQREPLTKESLEWLESAVVRGDTKPTGKKNKTRNKAKKVNTKNTDPPQEQNRALTIEHDVHSEEEKEEKEERNENEKEEEYQDVSESQDVCEDRTPNNTSQLDFLECDFLDNNGGHSNWADDVDEHDQQNNGSTAYNASQTTFTTSSPDSQGLSSHLIDAHASQEIVIAKASVSVKVIPRHSQDARLCDDTDNSVRRGQHQDPWQADRSHTEAYSDHTSLRSQNQRWHQGPHPNDFTQHHHHHSAQPPHHERQQQPRQPRHNQSIARNHYLPHHHEQNPRHHGSYQRLPRPNIHTERSRFRSHPPSIPPWQNPLDPQVQNFNGAVKNQRSTRNFRGKGSLHPLLPKSATDSPCQEQQQPCPPETSLVDLGDITKTKESLLSFPPPLQPTISTTETWGDREKVAKLLTSRWDIAMASVGHGPDGAVVYYSSE